MTQLTNEQRKILAAKRISMEVSPFEAQIVKEIRKVPHGRFIIQMLDGIPIRFITEQSFMVFEETEGEEVLSAITK